MSRTCHDTPLIHSEGQLSVDAQSAKITRKQRMNKSLYDNQQSWAFKSKEPKVAIYRDEEKRIKLLYGSKNSLKYKIKLNDKILDSAKDVMSPKLKGKLNRGSNIEPNQIMQINVKKMNERREKEDIFGTQKKLHLGPGDYQPKVDITKNASPQLRFSQKTGELIINDDESLQRQFKKIRQFDGSAATIKAQTKKDKWQPTEATRTVDRLAEVAKGSKAEAVFNSRSERFAKRSYLNYANNPGPQDYDAHAKEPQYIIKGPVDTQFGSTVDRNSLLQRDISKSPFKNPTNIENPSPNQYKSNLHEMGREAMNPSKQSMTLINAQSNEALLDSSRLTAPQDHNSSMKPQPNFVSAVQREFLESVSKEIRQNPGPGSYLHDQLMKDKMRALSFQVC